MHVVRHDDPFIQNDLRLRSGNCAAAAGLACVAVLTRG